MPQSTPIVKLPGLKKSPKTSIIKGLFTKMNDQNKKNTYFKLHVDPPKSADKPQHHQTEKAQATHHNAKPKASKLKLMITDLLRQLGASLAILAVGIVVMNWSAYSQVLGHRWQKFWGNTESPLEEIVQTNQLTYQKTLLKTSGDPEVQKRQIPELNIEVAPTDNRIIIPRIDKNIPVMRISSQSLIDRNWGALEAEMQNALRDGVVHYPGTSLPGQAGNIAITGHSSYFPWDPGRFKDVFALLHDVVEGDKIVMYWNQDKFLYEIEEIKVVLPEDISVLKQTPDDRLTLITCTPIGTNVKRLIVIAKPIDDPEELAAITR